MKYQVEVGLDLPRKRVIDLFDSFENLKKWQPGLKSVEHMNGEVGHPGAKSKLFYDMNGRKIEMIETIIERDLPDVFSGTYDAKGVHNIVENRFIEDGADKTRWVIDTEFQFSGLMKLMGFFMKGAFPKQTLDNMNNFKTFAESAQ
jgi:hypothetical protein